MVTSQVPAIRFEHVSKYYRLGVAQGSLRDLFASVVRRRSRGDSSATAEDLWALQDVSFEVAPGQILGLVGANGAGKSTILKLLSRITRPTRGNLAVAGRVSALIELGAGFHPDLTGRENAFLSGAILGLTRREIDERLASIIDFSELGQFIDTPVKRYSSGMYVRLGFAVAVHVDPDVLLIDEVLAVGDVKFRDKCMRQIDAFRRQGKTMVVVSHDRSMLERLCDRAIYLAQGQVVEEGPIDRVMDRYYRQLHLGEPVDGSWQGTAHEVDDARPVVVTAVRLFDADGRPRDSFVTGEPLVVQICFRANRPVEEPVVYCDLCYNDQLLNGNNTSRFELATGAYTTGDTGKVEITYSALNLLAGEYHLRVGITKDVFTQMKYHVVDYAAVFAVSSGIREGAGLVHLPQQWHVRSTGHHEKALADAGEVLTGWRQ
jgi:ABC-type polysaccharide/polyol phosphate transport system ATPase subunit